MKYVSHTVSLRNVLITQARCRGNSPGTPLTYFNDGGGGPSDFFGSEILAKSDFFGSMKDSEILLGREIKNRGIFWGYEKRIKHEDAL